MPGILNLPPELLEQITNFAIYHAILHAIENPPTQKGLLLSRSSEPAPPEPRSRPAALSSYRIAEDCLNFMRTCRWFKFALANAPFWAYIRGNIGALSRIFPSLHEYLVLDAMCPCNSRHIVDRLAHVKFVSILVHECQSLGCNGDAARYTAVPRPFHYERLPANLRSLDIREDARAIHLSGYLLPVRVNVFEFPNLETAKLHNCLMLPYGPALRALDYRAPEICHVSYKHLRSVVKRSNGLRELRLAVSRILEADRLYFQIRRGDKSRVELSSARYVLISTNVPSMRALICGFSFPSNAEVHLIYGSNQRYPLTDVDMARLAGTMRWPGGGSDIFAATLPGYGSFSAHEQLARQMAQPPRDFALYTAVRLHLESGLVCLTFAENIAAALAPPEAFGRESSSLAVCCPRRTVGTRVDFRTTQWDPVDETVLPSGPSSRDLRWMCSLMRDLYGPRRNNEATLVLYVDPSLPDTPSAWAKLLMPFDACHTLVITEVDRPSGQGTLHCYFDRLAALSRYLGNGVGDAHDHEDTLVFVNERIRLVLVSRADLGDEPEAKLLLLNALSVRAGWYPPSSEVKWSFRCCV